MLPDIVQSGLKLWCDDFVFICFFVFFLSTVCCAVFILLIWVVSRPRAAKNAQTSHWGALLFFSPPPLLFSGPLQSTLGVCFPSSVSSVVPLTCVVHSCSPLLSYGASRTLKKKSQGAPTWGKMYNAVFSLFSIIGVTVRGKPNESLVPCIILYFMIHTDKLKMITSCFLCAKWAKSTPQSLTPGDSKLCPNQL